MSKDTSNGLNNKSFRSSEDEESNQSFVKKVRSRVSGLIPSSLTKWFGSESTHKAIVRLREDDEDDIQIQPPVKRAKIPNSAPVNNHTTPAVFLPPRQPSKSLFLRDDNVPGPSKTNDFYNSDDKDSESGESTSGYSSIAKATVPSEVKKDAYDITNVINANRLFSSSNYGHNRSLFMDRSISSHANTSLSSRRPSFSASTFGSPGFVDRTLSTQRIMNSPFYNGCTMYGGAAAHNKPKAPRVQVKPINETAQNINHSASLSKTARRILDTLEQYATDVNRIPHPLKDKKPLVSKCSGARPYLIRERRAPNIELQVPTVPDLLKMKLKERLQDSTVAVRHIASTSKSAQDEYKTTKHTNKIKSRISSVREKPEEIAAPKPNLPDISLPITTLPKFDLLFPSLSSNTTKSVTVACNEALQPRKTSSTESVELPEIMPNTNANPKISTNKIPEKLSSAPLELLEFKFADPLVLAENIKSIIAINDFKFSEPVIFNKLKSADGFNFKFNNNAAPKILENVKVDLTKFKSPSDTWECSSCLLRNLSDKIKCVACEVPKRTEVTKPKIVPGSDFKISDNKWECTSCMVRNLNKDGACVACSAPKQKPNGPISSFGNKFKPPSATWECTTCMIRNKDELDRCAACETPKVGDSAPKPQKLMDIFKMKSNQWECGVCMVRNDLDKTKCIACETPNPNTTTQSEIKSAPKFSFGIPTNTKTTISSSVEHTDSDKLVTAPAPSFSFGIKNIAPESSNKTPQFIFGGDQLAVTELETSKPTFTFGLQLKSNAQENQKETEVVKDVLKQSVALKRTLEPETKDETPVAFKSTNIGQSESSAKQTTTPNKFFVSSPTAFTPPDLSKTISEPQLSFKFNPPTISTSGFNMITTGNMVPSPFATPITVGLETQSKSLFQTLSKPLFTSGEAVIAPSFKMPPPNKTLFETPVKPLETPVTFSKPLFEAAMPQPKQEFESSTPTLNVGFTGSTFSFSPKPNAFSFGQKRAENDNAAAPAFNFGVMPSGGFSFNSQAVPPPAFNFNPPKTEQSTFPVSQSPTNMFGAGTVTSTQAGAPLQNGLFNFGREPAKAAGFNFGSVTTQQFNLPTGNSAPDLFSFGSSQPAPPSGGFSFGTTSTPTFNANIKPAFNFTGGSVPNFSAQPTTATESAAVNQRRKIRAVRRNPQR